MPRSKILYLCGVACLALGTACSSSQESMTAPEAAAFAVTPSGAQGLSYLKCAPGIPASQSVTVGVLGGIVRVGPHRLIVPPGALLGPKTITASVTTESVLSVRFQPEGLRFLVPAILTENYASCSRTSARPLQVVYTSDNLLDILELLPSVDNPRQKTVTGLISHFSRYAVAY